MADIRRGLTYKPTDIREDGVRVLRSSNIDEDTFTLKVDDVFVNNEAVNIDEVDNGDILITAANGSSKLVGKHAIISSIDSKTVHGGFMLLAKTKQPYFFNALMSSVWYEQFIHKFVAGGNGAIGNLSKLDIEKQVVIMPIVEEQVAIGTFFSTLDHLITLQQRQQDLMKKVKENTTTKRGLINA